MAMRAKSQKVSFTDGKFCKIRGTYNNNVSGVAHAFVSEFAVQVKGSKTFDMTEDVLIKGLCDNYFDKLAAIQSTDISWTKVYIEPNVEDASICFYGFISPIEGKVGNSPPKDQDYVLNLLLNNNNQSRNVILPGVASDLKGRSTHRKELEELEKAIVSGFAITQEVTLTYIRINKKDEKEDVVGALFTGFRKRTARSKVV